MSNQVLEYTPSSPAQNPFARPEQERPRPEAELEERLRQLRAMSRIPEALKERAEAQLREAHAALLGGRPL